MALHKTDAELLDLIHSVTTKSTSKPDRSFGCKHRTGKETSNEESHEEADTEFADRQNVSGSDFSTEKMESELSAGQADTQTKGGNLNIDSELDDGESDEDKSYLFLLSKDELVHSLQDCRTELDLTNKKVEKLERQLKKSDDYNSVLRKMVEKLSSEIHRMKHVRTVHMHVQVDKEDLLNYTTGGVVAPSWREDDHSAITMALEGTSTEKKDNSQLTIEGMSIAESVKAAAEAAVQQQQQTEQEAMLAQSGYQYDVTSGLYYHAESGYYYDPATSLFYDPKSLTYYYYDYNQGKYMFHSKVETQHPDVSARKTSKRQTQSVKASIPKDSCSTLCDRKEGGVFDDLLADFQYLSLGQDVTRRRQHALELAQNWPPCIRMIVTASDHLSVGSLFIVPCTGASIGREKAAITIPDLNVSKLHATISYNQDSCVYEIVDNASQNGTLVNDQRISEAKVQSCPVVVSHGSMVQVAGTRLLCHIHAGTVTCDACEPGVVRAGNQKNTADHKVLTKEQRKLKQRREINQIKKKYGLKNSKYEDNAQVFTNPQYEDKASVRRQTVGSDVPGHKHEAPASVTRPITSSNVGHKLLSKMGWKEGESLGKDNSGIQEPISITMRVHQTAGLGSAGAGGFSVDDAGSVDMKKAARRVQAQERYKRIQTGEDTKQSDHRTETSLWSQGVTEFNTG
ncbi:angiogenic factor with G patch and FHA domains 1-like isoform X2 [Mya arenaria]|uniref:angiogenic factor with G patch and FHA domains 1-like isoform X2 n=1 Tax=Mya arenaria TaxID=6604 RepID=UPI0022E40AC6|nr:angiogenic factor with G patch and FHA domains 1-like isoform X2 [Mya arenaria]